MSALTPPQYAAKIEEANRKAREERVYDAVCDAYEAHTELIDYAADRWRPLFECSCGFKPESHLPGSLRGDIVFQHISDAIARAAVGAM